MLLYWLGWLQGCVQTWSGNEKASPHTHSRWLAYSGATYSFWFFEERGKKKEFEYPGKEKKITRLDTAADLLEHVAGYVKAGERHVGSTLIALARDGQGDILNTQAEVTRADALSRASTALYTHTHVDTWESRSENESSHFVWSSIQPVFGAATWFQIVILTCCTV